MNSSEKRRKELLEQTRRLYSDRKEPPAIHPRYGALYNRLYEGEEEYYTPGTFGVRVFLCLLLFAAFVTMDKQEYQLFHMDSGQLVNEITADFDVAQVWEEL